MPAYRPFVKVTKPVHKQIQVWPEGSSEALQNCFETTDWDMFKQAATYNNTTDLQEYSETVTAYITKCIDDVTITKTITVRANQKPWLTGEVYRLLKARNAAFRAGDEEGLKTARANLSRGIKEAKRPYSRRIAHRFSDSRDTRSLWQGIHTFTDYKPPPQTCDSTISLLNELNAAFAHFEAQNSTTAQKTPPPPGNQVMTLSLDSVRRSLSRINARKAPGPDNIPGRVLRDCAVELTDVFTDIFNISLSQAVVPTCFKATTIIPATEMRQTTGMLLWPSMVRLWRERAAPSSWVYTSQRTSPGLTTLQHWPRKHSSVSTSSANSEEPEPRSPSCAPSTEAPSKASWLAALLCGMAPATRPAARPFNG